MRRFVRGLGVAVLALAVAAGCLRAWSLARPRLDDRTTVPAIPATAVETVADLEYPPGNIAVAPDDRVFVTLHPDGAPPLQVVELVDGKVVPYPSAAFQKGGGGEPTFETPLAVRIDRQNRLWVLDHANFGRGQPRLLAFDLATGALVHRYDFPGDVAGLFSMLNDFQVSPDGTRVYIAETSPIVQRPALIVYDVVERTSRRLLEDHPSVLARDLLMRAGDRDMLVFGVWPLRIAVDSIALDPEGTWLYYGPVNGDRMFRVATRDLDDRTLAPDALAARVEDYGPKTLSDGLSMDVAGNVWVTDPEHSAVVALGPDRTLRTLVKDPKLRWPDGLSFGPDGWLYVTCSALQHVLFVSGDHMRAHAPYQVYRFKPGTTGVPGH